MDILRFTTAGNVDDGKSTLIGRLLYETGSIKKDVLESISNEESELNLAFVTDGLRAERERGVTIDVAYKYFSTPRRKFIIMDAPGHFQYTRNLITGASGAEMMIILLDINNGITDQTLKHAQVASFMKTANVIVAVNKMDTVNYAEATFARIRDEFTSLAASYNLRNLSFLPLSALYGDNVITSSEKMSWYNGKTLLQELEDCIVTQKSDVEQTRFYGQCIITNPKNGKQGIGGKLITGTISLGDTVVVLPGNINAKVENITHGYDQAIAVGPGQNITLYLSDNVQVKRGIIVAAANSLPVCTTTFEADICWLSGEEPLQLHKQYLLQINAQETLCNIKRIDKPPNMLLVNEFAKITIETEQPVCIDLYDNIAENGRGIIIDPITWYTCGAFIII